MGCLVMFLLILVGGFSLLGSILEIAFELLAFAWPLLIVMGIIALVASIAERIPGKTDDDD